MLTLLCMQPPKDCVQKTLKRLEEKVQGRVLKQVWPTAVASLLALKAGYA